MATTAQELESFADFARARLTNGGSELSLDELFDLWRLQHPSDAIQADNLAAVNAAIRDFEAGDRGTPAGEHSRELRRAFGLKDE